MKKTIKSLKSIALLALILVVTIACDKDFANIDSNIEGIKNFDATSRVFPLVTYTQSVTPYNPSGNPDMTGVQTTELSTNLLGVYKDPNSEFGTTSASIITQVIPRFFGPDFGTDPVLEGVKLTVPYYSILESTDDNGANTYSLDSIFGNPEVAYKLSIYESKYLIRDLDPNTEFEEQQFYYSNEEELFCNQIGQLLYESTTANPFRPSPQEILVLDDDGEVSQRLSPRLELELFNPNLPIDDPTNAFLQNLFFSEEGKAAFDNANGFVDYFRGLIFKVEPITNDGSMIVLNFGSSETNIIVDYTNEEEIAGTALGSTEFTLNFNRKRVNTFNTTGVTTDLNGDAINGNENLYLKGLDGYMAVVDLFGDEEAEFRSKKDKWLINEANLIFHVDETKITDNENEPTRLLLFDLKNNVPVVDFFLDGSTNTTNPNNSKIVHAEALSEGKYKFRITNHINNILKRDSTNTKLGLYVSSNVNLSQNSKIQNAVEDEDDETVLSLIPTSSILQAKATILHGNQSLTVDKRPEFEIFYTEPEN
ncbi:DUF4270 domain-containing protein [uncultured Lacinutrix sp.]|uniref:DUF4270 domain-containing protein n=1 Tax=uncultured Lacinutrix sp. TaxID=574032 RepID=UPI0026340093|nr:DUF4270 domain-containing protein [uncultured Lacinutrix sp.]